MSKLIPIRLREPLLVLLLSAAVTAAVFFPAVFQGKLIYQEDSAGSDSLDHNITRRCLAVQSITKYGEFPLWEPKIACGAPLFAESEAGIFHPTFLLYFLPNTTLAVNLTIFSAILIAMLGSYAWSRCLGIEPLASGTAALAYGLGYTFLLRTEQLNIIHVIAWLPASLAIIYLGAAQAKKRWWFALVFIWTLQFLASHLQMFAICQLCCWVYIIYLLLVPPVRPAHSRTKLSAGFASALLFTVLLGAVQLLTLYELTPKTTRESAYSLELLQELSPTWPMLAGFIDPFYPSWRYASWNTETEEVILPSKMVIYARDSFQYIGILPILLCLNTLTGRRRLAVGIWLLAVFFLITALGPSHGVYYALWKFVPFVSSFRFPGRFAIPLMCALACLASIGAQNLIDLLRQRLGPRLSASAMIIILLITCGDLGYVNSQVQGYLPSGWDTPPLVLNTVSNPQRIYSPYNYPIWNQELNRYNNGSFPRQNVFWKHRSLLSPGLLPLYGQEAPDDYLGFVMGIMLAPAADRQAAICSLFNEIQRLQAPEVEILAPKVDNWLRVMGISHIITPVPLPEGWPQAEFKTIHCAGIPEMPDEKVYVYALSRTVEKIRLVPALQKHISANDIDLVKVLQNNSPDAQPKFAASCSCLYELDFAAPASIGQVNLNRSTNHLLQITTSCDRDAYLVIANTYDDNWQAWVDGRPAPVRLTNFCMQSLAVPAGKHRIEMRYISPAFSLGWKISLTALAVFLGLAAAAWRSHALSSHDSAAAQGN